MKLKLEEWFPHSQPRQPGEENTPSGDFSLPTKIQSRFLPGYMATVLD